MLGDSVSNMFKGLLTAAAGTLWGGTLGGLWALKGLGWEGAALSTFSRVPAEVGAEERTPAERPR